MIYPDFPLESIVRPRDDAHRAELLRAAARHDIDGPDVTCLVADDALRLLARGEEPLRRATELLRAAVDGEALVEGPVVRYVEGARRLEPHMRIALHAPAATLPVLQDDLQRRAAFIVRLEHRVGTVVIEAEAPLARLLGYADWLAACTGGRARVQMWLCRYRISDKPGAPEELEDDAARMIGA
jgi:elongation factor G-like protein